MNNVHAKKNVLDNDQLVLSGQLPMSQSQIYQKIIHLQTILLLAQLNSTYYQINNTLSTHFANIETKYTHLKIKAFRKIQHSDRNIYQINRQIQEEAATQQFLRFKIGQKSEVNSKSKGLQPNRKTKILDKQQINLKISIKSKLILSKMVKLLRNKQLNLLSWSIYSIIKITQQNSTLKLNSSKSSRIQTIDSQNQKNKIFKRSHEKRIQKKSFSSEKSKTQQRAFLQAPIRYQPYKNNSAFLSADYNTNNNANTSEYFLDDNSNLSSQINQFIEKANDMTTKEKKINLVNLYRNRSITKSTSNERHGGRQMLNQKEDALKELIYLKKKYKKLIAEFNWFSERFLKVIEEQNYVK